MCTLECQARINWTRAELDPPWGLWHWAGNEGSCLDPSAPWGTRQRGFGISYWAPGILVWNLFMTRSLPHAPGWMGNSPPFTLPPKGCILGHVPREDRGSRPVRVGLHHLPTRPASPQPGKLLQLGNKAQANYATWFFFSLGNIFFSNIYLFRLSWVLVVAPRIFSCSMQTLSCGLQNLVPWPGIELRPLHWEHRVLASGPPGKSHILTFVSSFPCVTDKIIACLSVYYIASTLPSPFCELACLNLTITAAISTLFSSWGNGEMGRLRNSGTCHTEQGPAPPWGCFLKMVSMADAASRDWLTKSP